VTWRSGPTTRRRSVCAITRSMKSLLSSCVWNVQLLKSHIKRLEEQIKEGLTAKEEASRAQEALGTS
jgi:hypothetical protein